VRERVLSSGLEAYVRLAGFRHDLERILPCLELLVHPAELEGLGVSLLQASSAGVPIVASAVGGIPDAVHDGVNGILLPPADVPLLTRAVIELLRDSARARRMGEAGRQRVEREFSIDSMVEGNLRVYRELLGSRQRVA
jgi:glycosyltransferase involved in cell wall biosynthesis